MSIKLSVNSLLAYDRRYFECTYEDGDEKPDRDSLLSHLATYVFDTDDQWELLFSINKQFGVKVLVEVIEKLKNRDHDT